MSEKDRALRDLTETECDRLTKTVSDMAYDGRLKVVDKVDILKVCVRATERRIQELKEEIAPDSDIVQ